MTHRIEPLDVINSSEPLFPRKRSLAPTALGIIHKSVRFSTHGGVHKSIALHALENRWPSTLYYIKSLHSFCAFKYVQTRRAPLRIPAPRNRRARCKRTPAGLIPLHEIRAKSAQRCRVREAFKNSKRHARTFFFRFVPTAGQLTGAWKGFYGKRPFFHMNERGFSYIQGCKRTCTPVFVYFAQALRNWRWGERSDFISKKRVEDGEKIILLMRVNFFTRFISGKKL